MKLFHCSPVNRWSGEFLQFLPHTTVLTVGATTHFQYEAKPPKYCVDFWGNTIFGDAEYDDDDAACECSRKQWELGTIALRNAVGGQQW